MHDAESLLPLCRLDVKFSLFTLQFFIGLRNLLVILLLRYQSGFELRFERLLLCIVRLLVLLKLSILKIIRQIVHGRENRHSLIRIVHKTVSNFLTMRRYSLRKFLFELSASRRAFCIKSNLLFEILLRHVVLRFAILPGKLIVLVESSKTQTRFRAGKSCFVSKSIEPGFLPLCNEFLQLLDLQTDLLTLVSRELTNVVLV